MSKIKSKNLVPFAELYKFSTFTPSQQATIRDKYPDVTNETLIGEYAAYFHQGWKVSKGKKHVSIYGVNHLGREGDFNVWLEDNTKRLSSKQLAAKKIRLEYELAITNQNIKNFNDDTGLVFADRGQAEVIQAQSVEDVRPVGLTAEDIAKIVNAVMDARE